MSMNVGNQKVQPVEISGCSYGDLSGLVLTSLSLKREPVYMHTRHRHSRGSKKIYLISSQRQTFAL